MLIVAKVDSTLIVINTKKVRVKIGDKLIWLNADEVIERGMIMLDEDDGKNIGRSVHVDPACRIHHDGITG